MRPGDAMRTSEEVDLVRAGVDLAIEVVSPTQRSSGEVAETTG